MLHDGLMAAARVMIPLYAARYRRFERRLRNAREIQQKLMLDWVKRCRRTKFGTDHHFETIRTLADFRKQVPVGRYSYFEPYIDAVGRGECEALFPPEERPQRFTITTGSTGKPKLNPCTPTWLKRYSRAWDLWGVKMLYDHRRTLQGRILQIIGSWDMGKTPGGIPISMVSALNARRQHPMVRPFYSIPTAVTQIKDATARYYATLRLSMCGPIGLIVLMNPGNLLRLVEMGNENAEELIRDIREGTLSSKFDIPQEIREQLARRIRQRNPRRAQELTAIAQREGRLYPKDYWNRPIIACWIGGTAGYQSRYLKEYFGDSPLRDQGLVSSEGRHTIPIEDNKPEGVLSIDTGFYEFIPVSEAHLTNPISLEGHELEIDKDYSIVMTTHSGYFRFNIGDIVRCRGFVGEAPVLEFLQKQDRIGDLEGEKVTEHQFLDAANETARDLGMRLGCVTAVPIRPERAIPYYTFIIEHGDAPDAGVATKFLSEIDRRLMACNFLYSARRREGVLDAPQLLRIPVGAWERHIQAEIARRGTGEAHYKHPGLVQDASFLDHFHAVDTVRLSTDSTASHSKLHPEPTAAR